MCTKAERDHSVAVVGKMGRWGLRQRFGSGAAEEGGCVQSEELRFLSADNREPRDVFKQANKAQGSSFGGRGLWQLRAG